MDLWQLKVFVSVVENKSFSLAAREINLTQPTVSSHIKELENYFGCRLLDRMGKNVVPTGAGKLLFERAKKLLKTANEVKAELEEFLGSIRGELLVGASTIPGGYILPRILKDFTRQNPDVTIQVKISDTQEIIDDIISNRFDAGIVGARVKKNQIIQKKLIEDELCLVVPKSHKWAGRKEITADELRKEPFILREKGSGTRKTMESHLEAMGLKTCDLKVCAVFGGTAAVVEGIKSGIGISILSPLAAADYISEGKLHALKIKGITMKRHFYLTTRKNSTPSPVCRAFMDFLENFHDQQHSVPGMKT